jgi:hypothetical protein
MEMFTVNSLGKNQGEKQSQAQLELFKFGLGPGTRRHHDVNVGVRWDPDKLRKRK